MPFASILAEAQWSATLSRCAAASAQKSNKTRLQFTAVEASRVRPLTASGLQFNRRNVVHSAPQFEFAMGNAAAKRGANGKYLKGNGAAKEWTLDRGRCPSALQPRDIAVPDMDPTLSFFCSFLLSRPR